MDTDDRHPDRKVSSKHVNLGLAWAQLFMESLYLRGHTIQEVGGKMMIGSSILWDGVIDGSLCS